jgi:hypothetical protein
MLMVTFTLVIFITLIGPLKPVLPDIYAVAAITLSVLITFGIGKLFKIK